MNRHRVNHLNHEYPPQNSKRQEGLIRELRRSALLTLPILILSLLIGNPYTVSATTYHVALDGTGHFTDIQSALDVTSPTDTVLVKAGTYKENLVFGFTHNIVLRSESGPELTVIDGSGFRESVVVFRNGQTRSTFLEGFTLKGGEGSELTPGSGGHWGGGILIQNSEPTIIGNVITNNGSNGQFGSTVWGGGILCETRGSGLLVRRSPLIIDNIIKGNSANGNGGGIGAIGGCGPEIRNNIIIQNIATAGDGGGIWLINLIGPTIIEENRVLENHAGDHGGGLYLVSPLSEFIPDVRVTYNIIASNSLGSSGFSEIKGSGVYIEGINCRLTNNHVIANRAESNTTNQGAGIGVTNPRLVEIANNIIAKHKNGGGIACTSGPVTISRNLSWDNEPTHGSGACDRWELDNANIVADPLFCASHDPLYSLAENSPAFAEVGNTIGAYSTPACPPVSVTINATWSAIKARVYTGSQRR